MMKVGFFSAVIAACSIHAVIAQSTESLPLIPYPKEVDIGNSTLRLNNTRFKFSGDFAKIEQENTNIFFRKPTAKSYTVTTKKVKNLPKEAYTLSIKANEILISASDNAGAFYALQTFSQLVSYYTKGSQVNLPILTITDQPSYKWRGFMLDVSRHFFTLKYLKKTIDRMAFYKANKLHLHLTDDQGWRVEIKQYPLLTKVGAWRSFNNQDSACMEKAKENPDFNIDPRMIKTINGEKKYGGFYTQKELKELITYAQKKQIEIIPEIDMPGHFNAAIRAYPFLTGTTKTGWGKNFSIPISPCKEDVFAFTQNVLKEIFDLFPSKYVHIGADEVEKTTWAENPACTQLMKDSGISSVAKLQSYFIHRIQRFVEANGKKLITWDDALEGGINSNVTVMYWRNWEKKAPYEALQNKNDLVMSPNEPFYFDYQPDKNSIYNVYHRKITTAGIDNKPFLLGGQANLWTEMVPTENRADYLIYPRYIALTESLWSNNQTLYPSFLTRLNNQYPILDKFGIHYRLPDLDGFAQESVFIDSAKLKINLTENSNLQLHYTLDNSIPTTKSPSLNNGLVIQNDTTVKVVAFNQNGSRGDIYKIHYRKTKYQEAVVLDKNTTTGLQVNYYKGYFNGTSHIKKQEDSTFITSSIAVPASVNAPSFALDYNGYIDVPETGIYSFYFTCDDGGILKIGNEIIVDNDGLHSALEKSGQAALQKGLHPFQIRFVEGGGGFTIKLQYSLNGSALQDIPAEWFKH